MSRSEHHPGCPVERGTQITLAVISAIISGAIRAVAGWLLDQLTTG